ncbi:MAG: hypothetical protein ACI395_00855 [Candidatus Cryptobacteroides sp.]
MRKYRNEQNEWVVVVEDFGFLRERNRCNWLSRHYLNVKHRKWLRKASKVIASDKRAAADAVKYYFIPKSKIEIHPKDS